MNQAERARHHLLKTSFSTDMAVIASPDFELLNILCFDERERNRIGNGRAVTCVAAVVAGHIPYPG